MSKIAARDVVLSLDGQPIAGATDAELSLNTVMLTSRCKADKMPQDEPDHVEWNISSSNITGREKASENTISTLQNAVALGTPLKAKFIIGSMASYEGTVLITSLNINAPVGDRITASATMKGIDNLTKSVV